MTAGGDDSDHPDEPGDSASPGHELETLQYATPTDQLIIAPPWGVPIVCASLPLVAIAGGLLLWRLQAWPILMLVCAAIGLATPLLMPVALLATFDCLASERRENGQVRSIAKIYAGIVLLCLVLDVAMIFVLVSSPRILFG